MVDDLEVREVFGEGNDHQSDHRVILFKMNLKPATILDNKESYNYNKADLYAIIIFMRVNWINNIKFQNGICGENVERSWHMITDIVDQCRKHFVPKMRKRKKRKPPWMDNRAHKAQKLRQTEKGTI